MSLAKSLHPLRSSPHRLGVLEYWIEEYAWFDTFLFRGHLNGPAAMMAEFGLLSLFSRD